MAESTEQRSADDHIKWPDRVWEPTRIVEGRQLWASRPATAEDGKARAAVSAKLGFGMPIPVKSESKGKVTKKMRLPAWIQKLIEGMTKKEREAILKELMVESPD